MLALWLDLWLERVAGSGHSEKTFSGDVGRVLFRSDVNSTQRV